MRNSKITATLKFVLCVLTQNVVMHAQGVSGFAQDIDPQKNTTNFKKDANVFAQLQSQIEAFERANPGYTLSIPQALQSLPQDFRSHFTALHTSQSLQGATPELPRILLFGKDAKSVLAFNGDPSDSGFNTIEFAEVDPTSGEIQFREMTFPQGDSNQLAKGKVHFSEKNPEKCAVCHGSNPHYIWTPYAKWPGAFGSRDDILEKSPQEAENWAAFRNTRKSHARYSQLIIPNEETEPLSPFRYIDPKADSNPTNPRYINGVERRPNFRLGALLMRHQARAAFLKAKSSPKFGQLKFELANQLALCQGQQRGLDDGPTTQARDILKQLDAPFETYWRFYLTPESYTVNSDFFPAFNTFGNAFQWHLWKELSISYPRLLAGLQEFPLEELAKAAIPTYPLILGDEGIQFFKTLDDISLIAGGLPNAFEANYLRNSANTFGEIDPKKACQTLDAL